jgi:hypothetical protein
MCLSTGGPNASEPWGYRNMTSFIAVGYSPSNMGFVGEKINLIDNFPFSQDI